MKLNVQDVRRLPGEAISNREPSRVSSRKATFESFVRIKTSDAIPTHPEVPSAKRSQRASNLRGQFLAASVAITSFS